MRSGLHTRKGARRVVARIGMHDEAQHVRLSPHDDAKDKRGGHASDEGPDVFEIVRAARNARVTAAW